MNSNLPANFILFMDERHSSTDICSGLVHMTATLATDVPSGLSAYRVTQTPPALSQIYTIHHVPGSEIPAGNYPRSIIRVLNTENNLYYKTFVNMSSLFSATGPTGEPIEVYKIASRQILFKGVRLKRNVGFTIQANANSNSVQNDLPNKKRSLQSASPFLALQALELAILKKETCPITLDEFSAKNTAVMPCGHLFNSLAIAESFKTCPNQCPICRKTGLATFV